MSTCDVEDRFSFRRAAVRVLSTSPSASISTKARTFSSLNAPSSRLTFAAQRTAFLPLQRRFASDEAATQSEPEADGSTAAEHGENSIAETASELNVDPSEAKENAAANFDSAAENATDAAETTAETTGGVASQAAASVAGAAAAVGDTLTSAAGFGGEDRAARSKADVPPAKTVYIGNLFFDVRSEDIKREFENAGPVVDARVISDSRGLSKGFGYVEFESIEAATKAIELYNLQNFEGRRLSVQYSLGKTPRPSSSRFANDEARPINPPSKTLFIGNMSFDMSDRDLNNLFREVKNVIDVRVAIDRRTGQPRGFAHADFTDVASAEQAMEDLRGKQVSGRSLRVDFSTSTGRASLGGVDSA